MPDKFFSGQTFHVKRPNNTSYMEDRTVRSLSALGGQTE